MDDIRATCATINPFIIACTETWFSDKKHCETDSSICNYVCVRDDRTNRIGGGVALWIKSGTSFERLSSHPTPTSIEYVFLSIPTLKLLFMCIYIPPQQPADSACNINNFVINTCDHFFNQLNDFNLCICADFNRFDISSLCATFDLIDFDSPPTLGNARLDRFLISADLARRCEIIINIGPPIDTTNSAYYSTLWYVFTS